MNTSTNAIYEDELNTYSPNPFHFYYDLWGVVVQWEISMMKVVEMWLIYSIDTRSASIMLFQGGHILEAKIELLNKMFLVSNEINIVECVPILMYSDHRIATRKLDKWIRSWHSDEKEYQANSTKLLRKMHDNLVNACEQFPNDKDQKELNCREFSPECSQQRDKFTN